MPPPITPISFTNHLNCAVVEVDGLDRHRLPWTAAIAAARPLARPGPPSRVDDHLLIVVPVCRLTVSSRQRTARTCRWGTNGSAVIAQAALANANSRLINTTLLALTGIACAPGHRLRIRRQAGSDGQYPTSVTMTVTETTPDHQLPERRRGSRRRHRPRRRSSGPRLPPRLGRVLPFRSAMPSEGRSTTGYKADQPNTSL